MSLSGTEANLKIDLNSFIIHYVYMWNDGLKSNETFKIHGNQQKSKDFEIVSYTVLEW